MAYRILFLSFGIHLASALNSTSPGTLCGGSSVVEASGDWVWSHNAVPSPSCTSPNVQNVAKMCAGDPTSVVIQGSGQPQCLSAQMLDCKFNMHDLDQLDFDVNMLGCLGTWAAPLWMTPDHWWGGGSSGEIDMMENCPTDAVYNNFAGGGNQVRVNADPNSLRVHTTMWKQADGDGVMSIHVKTCDPSEVDGNGACPEDGAAYLRDIYGLNGCRGQNCMYTMVSDLWNGYSGDDGYKSCAGGHTHASSGCSFSVTNIRMKATPGVFGGKCASLVGPVPTPAPTPPPAPSPTPAGFSYQEYSGRTSYNGHGGIEIDSDSSAPLGLTVDSCKSRCDSDLACDCASFRPMDGKCWKRAACVPSQFGTDGSYNTYVKTSGYVLYGSRTSYVGHGGIEIDTESTAPVGLSVSSCEARCDSDYRCDCVSFRPTDGKCWKRASCVPSQFGVDAHFDTYMKKRQSASATEFVALSEEAATFV